jgi:hypothetical protein
VEKCLSWRPTAWKATPRRVPKKRRGLRYGHDGLLTPLKFNDLVNGETPLSKI